MSFPRYPTYKDSGVEWLGAVPGHWEVRRIGYYFTERREKVSDKDFPALSVTKNGIVPQLDTAAKSDDGDNRKKVCSGDFVINSRSDRKGSAGASDLDGSVSLICTVMKPQEKVHTPFVHHLLRSQPFQEEFYRNGKGIVADLWSTNYSEMRNILLGMPPLSEQTQIAAFLDRETAKIDALVAEQRRLMELLKEKRQAVISHAVTRGLNPDVPMKPSGVEWLGEVPGHWQIVPLCVLTRMIQTGPFGSQLHSSDYVENGTPVINPSNIQDGRLEPDWSCSISAENVERLSQHKLIEGDIVFGRRGEMGRCAMVTASEVGWVCGTGSLNVRLADRAYPPFVSTYLRTEYVREWLKLQSVGSTMDNLNTQILGSIHVPVPPVTEQKAIAAFVGLESAKLDTLTTEAQRAIDLLQERRTALISAAVTGQIDVRDAIAA
jgi:type I restriction enzyme S subunit